ncbi:MAG: hypothetical protein U9R25_20355 [Chloroflexota bacterium]|nr:hypothetical protein [Chloroflexota bacterium]
MTEHTVDSGSADILPVRRAWGRTILLLVPLMILVAGSYFFRNTDPDYWWHVRTGQMIVETGMLPRQDIFSYTTAGRPWITHEWLSQVVFFLVQRGAGYRANVLLFGLLGCLSLLAVYAACRLRGLGELGASLLALTAIMVGFASANVRPQMVTALLVAVTVLILSYAKLEGKLRSLWILPVLFVAWVNFHGGYVIGLVLLWLAVVGETLTSRRRDVSIPLRILLPVALLSTVAVLLNPHGLEALLYPFSYAGTENASMRFIMEWQSPDFHVPGFLGFAIVLLVTTVVGLGGKPLGLTEVLWSLLLGFLALRSVRHVPLYAIAVMPLLGARLLTWLPVLGQQLATWRRTMPLLVLWLLLPITLLWAFVRINQGELNLQTGQQPSTVSYPSEGVAYLRNNDLPGNLLNEYAWGGYLIYELFPERLVFIDGRADVYGDAFMDRYGEVAGVRPGWRQVLEDYDIQVVLLPQDSPAAVLFQSAREWEQVFEGEEEVIFVREIPNQE